MTSKVSTTRLVFSVIGFVASVVEFDFDISSYQALGNEMIIGRNCKKIKEILQFLDNCYNENNANRLIVVFSTSCMENNYIESTFQEIKKKLWEDEIMNMLEQYEPNAKIKMHENMILFALPNKASIAFAFFSKENEGDLIERDALGEAAEYHKNLYRNITKFDGCKKL